ncbi:hypothetical protein ACIA5D_28050 [Actinoplanes sp. NPDC051513]|uniref:hypothetical protein n=1 Tax=Actinoplanes sp. NPDC051513 TaxID=3363908 RepID=UPI0037B7AEE9
MRWAEHFRSPGLWRRGRAPAGGPLPADVTGIGVAGEGVSVSAVRRVGDGVEVRLVAVTPSATVASISGPYSSAVEADLLGRSSEQAVDLRHVPLRPWEIRTLHLR